MNIGGSSFRLPIAVALSLGADSKALDVMSQHCSERTVYIFDTKTKRFISDQFRFLHDSFYRAYELGQLSMQILHVVRTCLEFCDG
jgi:hypothetical protein